MFTYLGKETRCWRHELWAVGSAGRVLLASPAGLAQPGPKGSGWTRFLPALAFSPKCSVPPAFLAAGLLCR